LDPRFAGAVPSLSRLGSTSLRVSWGVELGSRYRDQIRQTQDAGFVEDPTVQELVWVAHSALALARLPVTAELTTFWNTLNRAALGYVGEEYPRFEGNARTVARAQASGQRALAAGGQTVSTTR
jgi:hypothetical protein